MKRLASIVLLAAILVGCTAKPQVKYVFYFIGDGMGINQVRGTEIYNEATDNGPKTLNFTQFPVLSFVNTNSASALVTDSAAAGTALATGVKTYNGAIGLDKDGKGVTSIGDWAKAAGVGVGLITTVGINHATPAAFYAHVDNRDKYDEISTQFINSDVDFGAGSCFLLDSYSDKTTDSYEKMASEEGISLFRGPDFAGVECAGGRVLCLSGKDEYELPYAIDREEEDTKLSDFVKAGISYMEKNFEKEGFFLMIEGGKIDYACHANDAATTFMETNDMACSVDLALSFMERHPGQTLIVVTADHETGGLMLGSGHYYMNPERLRWQTSSYVNLTPMFRETFFPDNKPYKAPSWESVKEFFARELGLWEHVEVSTEAEASLYEVYQKTFGKGGNRNLTTSNLYSVNYTMVSEALRCLDMAAGYQYAHGSHSGTPVGVYAIGAGANAFDGLSDLTEIPVKIAEVAGY